MCGPPRLAVLLVLACTARTPPGHSSGPASYSEEKSGQNRFVPGPCRFTIPAGARVQCGWLTVPEDRTRSGSRTIRLHIAIYKSRSEKSAPDPVLWLVGGPGGRGHAFSSTLFTRVVAPFIENRDFIVLDVRGTGYSEPALACPEASAATSPWIPACRDRLMQAADLACYNSAAVAADLADLRRALGLREWNLMGESYGTRLALVAMRDYPKGIRSVVLDSVAPPEVDEYADGPAKFEGAVNALFAGCAADARCRAAFPHLWTTLLRSADELDRSPRHLSGLWHGTPIEVRLDGRQLLEGLHMALYESDLIPQIPRAIYHTLDGGADEMWREVMGRHAIFVAKRMVDEGAHLSFHCTEEVPFTDRARLVSEDRKRPWMRHVASGVSIVDACRMWPTKAADPREARAVSSALPVLLLAGEYDPVTPPGYAQSVASHLRHSHLFVFAAMGHQLTANTVSSCPQAVVLEFLDNPKRRPTATCVSEWKPRWKLE